MNKNLLWLIAAISILRINDVNSMLQTKLPRFKYTAPVPQITSPEKPSGQIISVPLNSSSEEAAKTPSIYPTIVPSSFQPTPEQTQSSAQQPEAPAAVEKPGLLTRLTNWWYTPAPAQPQAQSVVQPSSPNNKPFLTGTTTIPQGQVVTNPSAPAQQQPQQRSQTWGEYAQSWSDYLRGGASGAKQVVSSMVGLAKATEEGALNLMPESARPLAAAYLKAKKVGYVAPVALTAGSWALSALGGPYAVGLALAQGAALQGMQYVYNKYITEPQANNQKIEELEKKVVEILSAELEKEDIYPTYNTKVEALTNLDEFVLEEGEFLQKVSQGLLSLLREERQKELAAMSISQIDAEKAIDTEIGKLRGSFPHYKKRLKEYLNYLKEQKPTQPAAKIALTSEKERTKKKYIVRLNKEEPSKTPIVEIAPEPKKKPQIITSPTILEPLTEEEEKLWNKILNAQDEKEEFEKKMNELPRSEQIKIKRDTVEKYKAQLAEAELAEKKKTPTPSTGQTPARRTRGARRATQQRTPGQQPVARRRAQTQQPRRPVARAARGRTTPARRVRR